MRSTHDGRTRARRRADQRGAALVETVIVLPLVLLLTFGMIEFGFAFNEQGTVRAATRNAARAASTQPKAANAVFEAAAIDSLDASAANLNNGVPDFALVYDTQDGTFEPSSPAECTARCAYYDWSGTGFVHVSGHWNPEQRGACAGESDRVGVFMKVRHDFLTGFFTDAGVDLSSRTVMALEPYVGGPCAGS